MKKDKFKNLADIAAYCIGLRSELEQAEARFFLGLVEIERSEEAMQIILDSGCTGFDNFLRSYELCRVERYRHFLAGMKYVFDEEEAVALGAPAVIALAAVKNAENVPKFKDYVSDWRAMHKGLTPRYETAAYLLRQADPRPEIPKATKALSGKDAEIQRLREKNAALRKQVKTLKRKLSKYEKERV